jgi:hypothetical protein
VTDLRALLQGATTIELIDWPHQSVPATLHRAGFVVVGHEPDSLKRYTAEDERPADGADAFPLDDGGWLVSRDIAELPPSVDIVCTFRPPDEQPAIVDAAAGIGARAIWIEPDAEMSADARQRADALGLAFVDGESIAAAVRRLGITV